MRTMSIQATVAVFALALATSGSAAAEPPRTEWGDPDLRGVWDSGTLTPLERPPSFGDRQYLTEEEAEALRGTGVEQVMTLVDGTVEGTVTGELNEVWLAPGQDVVRSLRTSLVVDPPNGQIPFTQAGRAKRTRDLFLRAPGAPADSAEVRHVSDRCLITGMFYQVNPFYLNHHAIAQTPEHVAIHTELMSEVRIIPLDGRRQLDPSVRMWSGSSRGHWEGDTLVIETANFNSQSTPFSATEEVRIVERLTRVDEHTIDYQATYTDPASYTQPWTLENTLRAMDGPIYEYGCAEGNYALGGILRGARLLEQEAEEARQSR